MTKRLYYDCHVKNFSATVVSCEGQNGKWQVILDRTAFYPEGGGQPCDFGKIGVANVSDVREKNGEIFHTTDIPLEAGLSYECRIDWQRRFSFMQNHTGEHIVSGIIHRDYKLDNVGFHMGSDCVTIDISGELRREDLNRIQTLANQAVYDDIPVDSIFPEKSELLAMEYRSKKALDGAVRIVNIPGYDTCACCGTHCKTTGEVGSIIVLWSMRYKGGMRIGMLCGWSALADYSQKNRDVFEIGALLSCKPHEVSASVSQLQKELANVKNQVNVCKNQLFYEKSLRVPIGEKGVVFEEALTPTDLRIYAAHIGERVQLAAVFSKDCAGYKYALCSRTYDVSAITRELNTAFGGKGGGKDGLAQGSVTADESSIKNFFNS